VNQAVTALDDPVFTPELVVHGFSLGYFPMADGRHTPGVGLYRSDPRGVMPLDGFHRGRTLARLIRSGVFDVRRDTAFDEVIRACATPRPGDTDTWINDEIIAVYEELHRRGITHSVEAWRDDRLVGGLYGVHLRGAFFAESMFHRPELGGSGASKVCVAHLVDHLRDRGFRLLDLQMVTPVTVSLGAIEVPEERFMALLARALSSNAEF
jgi:leucyl/phenylalanyl-tRNA--protein transferase